MKRFFTDLQNYNGCNLNTKLVGYTPGPRVVQKNQALRSENKLYAPHRNKFNYSVRTPSEKYMVLVPSLFNVLF